MKKIQKIESKKATNKVVEVYKKQNEWRANIAQQAKDYKQPINNIIRGHFDNYIKIISYKECYECSNGSLNYRVFIKSDKKLPKQFVNSQGENDIKTMLLVNDKTNNIKCAINLPTTECYKAF